MNEAKTPAEFEQFAREQGHKVEDGFVIFEQQEAAQKFQIEAHAAGFTTRLTIDQTGSYAGLDDLSKRLIWYVTLPS